MNQGKVLIFIVAYNAEKTIASVLSRIPVKELPPGTEVLIIDDSSSDRTFEAARAGQGIASPLRVTVLRTPANQGYGGNQKIGYQYAIENGFDVVALLHGDGQYAPERLPQLIAPVLEGRTDACFGSRMMEPWAALRHGMPLYKYVGNRILSVCQNRLLGLHLTEFHSGYRVYSVPALRQIPFRYNTNDFHFDTEIIIQFALQKLRLLEIPIPTYYGDEICYVNGMAYAWNVIRTTMASRMHRMGMFYQHKYDLAADYTLYSLKTGYLSSHSLALSAVGPGSSVLDLACGPGYVARALRDRGCRVTGMDWQAQPAGAFDRFIRHDLDDPEWPPDVGTHDVILALDCLEHLDSPEGLLERLRERCYSEKTRLIFSVPNIGFFMTRLGLLTGQFNYGREGILDLTHKRLFTFKSFRRLLEQEGYTVRAATGIPAPVPKAMGDHAFSRLLLSLNRFLILLWPQMFSYQLYVEAAFQPPLAHLLRQTMASAPGTADSSSPRGA